MRRALTAVALVVALGAAACGSGGSGTGGSAASPTPDKGAITVGSKLDTEARLLGLMMAQTLEDEGYDVTEKIPTGDTKTTRAALMSGDIDIYWEFTGTGLTLLGAKPVGDPQEAYREAKELDAKNGVTWLPAASMNDTYALAVKSSGEMAGVKTLSELAEKLKAKPDMKLCVDTEGSLRADVLPVIKTVYGMEFKDTVQLAYELIPPAVKDGQCQAGIVYSTAALITKNDLRVLDDDKQAFGAYTPAPTIKTDTLKNYPDLEKDLADLTAALDTATITKLNAEVDIDKREPKDVARDFLRAKKII